MVFFIEASVWSIGGYALILALLVAFQKAFEHWKWESTRPTLSVTRPPREQRLLAHVLKDERVVSAKGTDGAAEAVLNAVDAYCWVGGRNWMMNGQSGAVPLTRSLALTHPDRSPSRSIFIEYFQTQRNTQRCLTFLCVQQVFPHH